ncbi:MAG: hypothetical protein HZB31_04475 [Nitrospirae bacterium]|nr:hypothetical protein [Nitrospirota bacterium]
MSDLTFPILGTDIPPMLGRTKIMQRLWSDLTKATPSNLSIIGPRFVGKTVIMNALSQRAEREDSPYEFVLYWHLGHDTPRSDSDFITQLCDLLQKKLASIDNKYAEHEAYLGKHSYNHLKEVTDLLTYDAKPILMIWDCLDKPLGQGNISGDLWNQMRGIFYGTQHKIVTATRKPLSELIRSEDALDSPFWNIFDMNLVRVEAFDDADCETIINTLHSHSFQPGAKTELINWSSGFPPFFLGLLNHIIADKPNGSIDNACVNSAASKAAETLSPMISALWVDCPASAKDIYVHLVERGDLPLKDIGKDARACLIEKGFAKESGNKLAFSSRMLQQYVVGSGSDTGSMARLFGTWDDYRSNIRSLLERRLAQIARFDDRLYVFVARAIQDIPDLPDVCLNHLTSIEERALDLIWQREFGSTKTIPQNLIDFWAYAAPSDKTAQRLKEQAVTSVPPDRWLQCGILQLLTGSKQGVDYRAQHVTKDTYVLINALHSFRNRNQHSEGQDMHVGVAVAAITTCLELLSCLERELAP